MLQRHPSRQRQGHFERPPNRQPRMLRLLRAQMAVVLLLAIVGASKNSLVMFRENSNACMEKV